MLKHANFMLSNVNNMLIYGIYAKHAKSNSNMLIHYNNVHIHVTNMLATC